MFFIFPDLGVRAPGFYRIQCFLMDIDITKSCIPIQATCLTAPFEVHSPKTFPGTQGLTQISKWFSEQGVHFNISRRIKYT
ncbi:velvet factor [Gorgonomyces haynaldii]|nr:velvet factor [Gorgonomyces haynaldii]